MDNNKEIKKVNRRAMPVFILLIVIGGIVGGLLAFLVTEYDLNTLSAGIKAAGRYFGMNIVPWLMIATAVALPVVTIPIYKKAKKLTAAWDGEDDEIFDAVGKNLSVALWISGAANIFSFFLMAVLSSYVYDMLADARHSVVMCTAAAFLCALIEVVIIQQKCVDAAKRISPEKTASVYDIRFQKKWIDSCDEAEKIVMGKCAFKAYSVSNKVCQVLIGILFICAVAFHIGFLPSLAVCVIWIVNQSVYFKETLKYSKAGNKIL